MSALGPDDGSGPPQIPHAKLHAERKKEDEDLAEKLRKEHQQKLRDMVAQNIAKANQHMQGYQPIVGAGDQGALEKVAYQAGMSPEGQVGEIITKMVAAILMALFGTHYWVQRRVYAHAEENGFAYKARADGTLPPIFAIDADRKPYGEPLPEAAITRDLIRQNGLIPPPSYEEAWLSSWDTYQAFMSGPNSLTDEQKRRTLIVGADIYKNAPSSSQRSEQQHMLDQQMANQRQAPTQQAPRGSGTR